MHRRFGLPEKGYSMTEALVVLALIGVIVAVTIPMMAHFLQSYRIQTASQQIAINLRFARNAAVKQKILFQLNFSPTSYVVLYDENGDGTITTNEIYKHADVYMPTGITILGGGLSTVTYDARGTASSSGNITLRGTDRSEWTITVTLAGGVTLQRTVEGIY